MKRPNLIALLFLLIVSAGASTVHAQIDQPTSHRTNSQVLAIWITNTETHLVPLADEERASPSSETF